MHRRRTILLWLALMACCHSSPGQALAHKNWAGSGLVVAPWWVGAELYALDPISFQDSDGDGFGDLNGITARLDYLAGLGVEGLVLSPMPLDTAGSPFDKTYGTEEDFGRLMEEAARRRIRVLADLPLSANRSTAETLAAARFWLTRGVAGLRLVGEGDAAAQHASLPAAARAERIRALRRLCTEFAGQRVLMEEDGDAPAQQRSDQPRANRQAPRPGEMVVEMVVRGPGTAGVHAAALRAALIAAERVASDVATPVLVTDAPEQARSLERLGDGSHNLAMARLLAAALLGSRGAPMLYFGQEVGMSGTTPAPMQWGGERPFTTGVPWIEMGPNAATASVASEDQDPDSLLNWYRKLGRLRHGNAALRQGTEEMLQTGDGDAVAWVRRARLGEGETPDVVVVLNCSARFISVSLTEGIGLHVLRTLAATYGADGAVSTRGLAIPPFGVFIGEVQRKAGLETLPDPPHHHR